MGSLPMPTIPIELALDLSLEPAHLATTARATSGDATLGEARAESALRLDISREFHDAFDELREGKLLPEDVLLRLRDLGRELSASLFVGPVRDLYIKSRATAREADRPLQIRLGMAEQALLRLPWELLIDPDPDPMQNDHPVASDPKTSVVRHPHLPVAAETLAAGKPPLRILGLGANPTGYPALAVATEKAALEKAVTKQRGAIEVCWAPGATLGDLFEALKAGTSHVLHFCGHGDFDDEGHGVLVLEDAKRQPHLLGGAQIGVLCRQHPELRVVVLNACHGAAPGRLPSVAAHLLRAGVSAVVAMQDAVPDAAATTFAAAMYEGLARGLPVDTAVAVARGKLFTEGSPAFALPALFLRARSGVLLAPHPLRWLRWPPEAFGVLPRWLHRPLVVLGVLVCAMGAYLLWHLTIPPVAEGGVVLVAPTMLRGEVRRGVTALCGALEAQGRQFARCVDAPPLASDAAIRERAKEAGAGLLVLVDAEGMARLMPLGALADEDDMLAPAAFDVARRADPENLALVLRTLGHISGAKSGPDPAHVRCPTLVPPIDPRDTVTVLTLFAGLLGTDCAPQLVTPEVVETACKAPSSSFACATTRLLYVDRVADEGLDDPFARDVLEAIRAEGPARFRLPATMKLARIACDRGDARGAAALIDEMRSETDACARMAVRTELVDCGGAVVGDGPSPCDDRVQEARSLGMRAWLRGRKGRWREAADDYGAAWSIAHEPMHALNRALALLRAGTKPDEVYEVLGRTPVASGKDGVYWALLRWVMARRAHLQGVTDDASVLKERYKNLASGDRVLPQRDDALKALICADSPPGPCVFETLAREKTTESEGRLRTILDQSAAPVRTNQ